MIDPNKKYLYFNPDNVQGEMDSSATYPVSQLVGIEIRTSGNAKFYFKGSKCVDATTIQVAHEQYAFQKSFMIAICDEINFGDKAFIKVMDYGERTTSPSDVTPNINPSIAPSFSDQSDSLNTSDGAVTTKAFKTISVAGQDDVVADAADDTLTIAAGSNVTVTTNASSDTITIAASSGGSSVDEVVSTGEHILKQTKTVIDTSGFNSLNTTPVELVAAQGADKMIIPLEVVVFADIAGTNTNATDLIVAYNGGTSFLTAVKYARRFMYNVGSDRITIMNTYVGTASNNLTTPINSNLTIALGGAPTTNCMTSLTVFTSYYVIDIS